jgi:hypothetical protein
MKTRVTPLVLAVAIFIVSTIPILTSAAAADPSPTGRSPKLLWTSERQTIWNRMKADYQRGADTLGAKWYKLVKDNAECGCRYADNGLWATLMYQWTGERRYVDMAWDKLSSSFLKLPPAKTIGNYVREYGIEFVVVLDWLWPGLTPAQRQELTTAIGKMLETELAGNRFAKGYRLGDSDQVIGTYFAVVLFQLIQPDNSYAISGYNHPQTGGLRATAADQTTARNAIRWYVERLAVGGEWIESAYYNNGTVNLLLMGSEAVKTATGVDNFPEVTQWTPQWAKRQIAFWTPDLAQPYQWGDEEHPRNRRLFAWTNASGLVAGLLQGTPTGTQLQQHLLDLIQKYGAVGFESAEPAVTGRLFFTFNPYAPAADWRTDENRTFHAPGTGLLLHRSGFDSRDSLFATQLAPRSEKKWVDHQVRYFGNFELWRQGEWVLTHPRGYAGAPNSGVGTNAVLMQGFGDMPGFKEIGGVSWGNSFAYQTGTTGGAAVATPYYDPPPVFVHEWTRGVLYLSGTTDTVIVYDRANVSDVLRRDRYYAADQALFDKAPAPKQWLLHMPVRPTLTAQAITWTTPGGQPIRWTPVLPIGAVRTVFDERALRDGGDPAWKSSVLDSELKYHVRLWPNGKRDWDTFLNVIQIGTPGEIEPVRIPGDVEGVRVSRPGESDVLAVFNAQPSARLEEAAFAPSHDEALRRARLRTAGYTVRWTAVAETTDLYLADLDPGKRWSIQVDGRLTLPSAGTSRQLARLTVSGTGAHTLVLTVLGDADVNPKEPVPVPPSGLRIIK